MTRQEHFEQWMRHNYPNVPLDYNSSHDYYVNVRAFYAYQAWKEAPLRRPCEKGQITKEQLKELKAKDDPATIVDRLNGWYGQTTEPYVVPKVQMEAAREIERLREVQEENKALKSKVERLLKIASEEDRELLLKNCKRLLVERKELEEEIASAHVIVKELECLIRNGLEIGKGMFMWDLVKTYMRKYINKNPAEAG